MREKETEKQTHAQISLLLINFQSLWKLDCISFSGCLEFYNKYPPTPFFFLDQASFLFPQPEDL